jgi:hypothetical protein
MVVPVKWQSQPVVTAALITGDTEEITPPRGYCSVHHFELGPAKRQSVKPPKPDVALFHYRAHRITEHRDHHFLQFHDCAECDRLEQIYSDALGYWMDHPMNCVPPDVARIS